MTSKASSEFGRSVYNSMQSCMRAPLLQRIIQSSTCAKTSPCHKLQDEDVTPFTCIQSADGWSGFRRAGTPSAVLNRQNDCACVRNKISMIFCCARGGLGVWKGAARTPFQAFRDDAVHTRYVTAFFIPDACRAAMRPSGTLQHVCHDGVGRSAHQG